MDFDWFMEVLRNGELQLVSRKWTEEEKEQLSRDIAACKAIIKEKEAKEAVLTCGESGIGSRESGLSLAI